MSEALIYDHIVESDDGRYFTIRWGPNHPWETPMEDYRYDSKKTECLGVTRYHGIRLARRWASIV